MTAASAAQALAAAMSAAVANADTLDVLTGLIRDGADVLAASASGIVVSTPGGELELLCATSHASAELELYEIQHDAGPCVEAARKATPVAAIGSAEIEKRWGQVGIASTAVGYQAACAFPLRWHGRSVGAMNVFYTDPGAARNQDPALAQAFADVAAIVILQTSELTDDQLANVITRALQSTTVIERAKGVLAFTHRISMAAAYDLLLTTAAETNASLTTTATSVINNAQL